MAVQKSSAAQGDSSKVPAAAELLMQRVEEREQSIQERAERRRRKRRRKRQREDRASAKKMHHSIETIKWCIIAICSVWVVSFVISIAVMIRVHSRVVEIEGQVKKIQNAIENPLATAGARLGENMDSKLREWFKVSDPNAAKE